MAKWTDDESRRLEELHAEGLSLRECAKRMDRPSSTVGVWAGKLELSFGTERTAEATAVKVLNTRERKAEAADRELRILELTQKQVLDVLDGEDLWPTLKRGEGGSEHEAYLNFIPARDMREHTNARSGSAAIIDKLADTTTEHDTAKSMLGQLEAALITAVREEEREAGESERAGPTVDLEEASPLDSDSER